MDKKLIAIIGAAIVIVGVFLPVLSSRSMSAGILLSGDDLNWRGLVVIGCALIGAVLALMRQTRHAIWPGVAILGFLVWQYVELTGRLGRMATIVSGDNVPPELAAMMTARMPQINMLGWAVMGIGALIMIAAGAMAWKSASAPPPAA